MQLSVRKHRLFFVVIAVWLAWCSAQASDPILCLPHSKTLDVLLEDVSHYKTTNPVHAGHLLSHLMWTEQWISTWAEQNRGPFQGLTEREKTVLAFAGLIHDVGKAGDVQRLIYYRVLDHERIGFEFVMQGIQPGCSYKNKYQTVAGKSFPFDDLFKELCFSLEEQKQVAILIALHSAFTGVLMKGIEDTHLGVFAKLLFDTAHEAGCVLSESLIQMVMAINIADVRAVYYPVEQGSSRVFGQFKRYPMSEVWGHCDWKLQDMVFAYLDAGIFKATKYRICSLARSKGYLTC
jgi:hypothetical protein